MKPIEKKYYDEDGKLFIRPYRLKDLTAIYGVSRYTLRRWINEKAAAYGMKSNKYFTVEQVKGIVEALGVPKKITPVVPLQSPLNKAV